jgi:hypothetical protein
MVCSRSPLGDGGGDLTQLRHRYADNAPDLDQHQEDQNNDGGQGNAAMVTVRFIRSWSTSVRET